MEKYLKIQIDNIQYLISIFLFFKPFEIFF